MYNRTIDTTISILGFVVYLEYFVTAQNAVKWNLNMDWYMDERDLLEATLRVHWSGFIESRLLQEFEERVYENEAKLAAQLQKEDVSF